MCGHLSSHHDPSPAPVLLSIPAVAGSSSGRARSVTALFQQLLKSTPGGATALQETSNGLRKQPVVSTLTANVRTLDSRWNVNWMLIGEAARYTGSKSVCEGT